MREGLTGRGQCCMMINVKLCPVPERSPLLEKKRTIMINLAVIAAVLLLALLTLLLSKALPQRDITPNAVPSEGSGVSITFEGQ